MQRLRSILVGLDFDDGSTLTKGSRTAAKQALWLANRTGAEVQFMHSTHVNPEDGPRSGGTLGEAGRAAFAAFVAEHGCAGTELILSEEVPWAALTRRVLSGDNDLVVVAKRNQVKRADRRLGSVSMKLVRKCPAPVWVVKPEHEPGHRCIVAATDLGPVGDRATEYAAFLAEAEGCKLYVVHAWQMPMELQLGAARMSEKEFAKEQRAIVDAARTHIEGMECVAALGAKAEVVLARDTPSHLILSVAEKRDPDLVVLGTISRGGIAGFLVGNTCERLIYRLDCSLLTVKPEDFVCPLR